MRVDTATKLVLLQTQRSPIAEGGRPSLPLNRLCLAALDYASDMYELW
jgi:hypothetical protein